MIRDAGAYGYSMASNYNTRPRPAEVAFMGENVRLIKHRENIESMLKDEEKLLQEYKNDTAKSIHSKKGIENDTTR